MESEIGTARARAPPGPGRARADGAPAGRRRRHAAPGDRQPRLGAEAAHHARLLGRDPAAQRGRDGGHGLALRLRRAEHDPDRRGGAAPGHARAPARRQAGGGRLQGPARRLPLRAGGHRRGGARAARRPPRAPDARAHRQAGLQGLPAPVRLHARVRRDVRALGRHLPGGPRAGPGADRVRRPAAGADGDADHPDRPAVGGPLRLAPGADRGVRARDRGVRARAAPPPRALRRAARRRSGASSTRPSPPTTRRSARSTTA